MYPIIYLMELCLLLFLGYSILVLIYSLVNKPFVFASYVLPSFLVLCMTILLRTELLIFYFFP